MSDPVTQRSRKHDCDKQIRANWWAMSGHRQTGDVWKCSCGKTYVHNCDEAHGCYWTLGSGKQKEGEA